MATNGYLAAKKNYGVTLEVLNENLHLVFGGGRGVTHIDLQIYYSYPSDPQYFIAGDLPFSAIF